MTIEHKPFMIWGNIAGSVIIAVAGVSGVTGILCVTHFMLDKAHIGMIYLLLVAATAIIGGTRTAILTAVLSFFAWNYFFMPPRYSLFIADTNDWILLLSFLAIGIMTGQITGRMRDRKSLAIAREQETAALCNVILGMCATTDLNRLAGEVVATTNAAGCTIFISSANDVELKPLVVAGENADLDDTVTKQMIQDVIKTGKIITPGEQCSKENSFAIGAINCPGVAKLEIDSLYSKTLLLNKRCIDTVIPLATANRMLGVMYVTVKSGNGVWDWGKWRLLMAFASMAAAILESRFLIEESVSALAKIESDRFKSLLLSSLAHNLKTPLASLTATLSSVQQKDVEWDRRAVDEQLRFISADVNRLTETLENVFNLAALESENWKPEPDWIDFEEILGAVLRHFSVTESSRVDVRIQEDLPLFWGDPVQVSQLIRHIIENAISYSPSNSPVHISAETNNDSLSFCVEDYGPGILPDERDLVFRRFYRGKMAASNKVRGTGLGLAICKEIIQSHGGNITVDSSSLGGARVKVILPRLYAKTGVSAGVS